MAEDFNKKVTLIEIQIDNAHAIKEADKLSDAIVEQGEHIKETSEAIKDLEKQNKELNEEVKKGTKTTGEANKAIDSNVDKILALKKAQLGNRDELTKLNAERRDAVKVSKIQANSLDALRKTVVNQKKELNGLNTATEEGVKRFNELSKSLKENNEKIKELDTNAGDFKTTIDSAEATGLFSGSATGAIQGFQGMTKAALQFILTPIGAILGAIVLAIALVNNAMNRNEESANKLKKAFAVLGGMVNFILEKLEPLGEFLIEGIVKGFELAAEAAEKAMSFISDVLDDLGFEAAAKSVRVFSEEVKQAANNAQLLAEAEANLQKEQRLATKIMLDYQKQAEKLRQIRDDDTKSFKERIKANEDLGKVLDAQLQEEKRIAQIRIDAANLRISLEGEHTEALDQQAEALTELADIEERITGQRSEQLVNRNSLEKERRDLLQAEADKVKAIADKAAAEQAKRDKEELDRVQQLAADKIKNQEILNQRLIELEDYRRLESNRIRLSETKDIETSLALRAKFEEEDFALKMERISSQEEALKENTKVTAEERAILQAEIDLASEEAKSVHSMRMVDIAQDKADKELEIEKLKNDKLKSYSSIAFGSYAAIAEISSNKVEGTYRKDAKNLQRKLDSGIISEEEFTEKKNAIDQKRAKDAYKIQKRAFEIDKAINIVSIGIDTAKAVTKALASFPPPASFALAGASAAFGALQLGAVVSSQPPPPPTFAQGGSVTSMIAGGKDHAQGGTKYFGEDGNAFEVQSNEGIFVTKREATNPALQMLSDINTQYGGSSMFSGGSAHLEEGGFAEGGGISEKSLSLAMRDAVQDLPSPVVEVVDLLSGIEAHADAKSTGVI